jgi:hypothetical protein
LNDIDQYRLNSFTKFLFEKYNFIAIMENAEKPDDLASNNCMALNSNVINNKSLLKTKLIVELKNCKGEVVFTSKEGESREKDLMKAHHQALRDAFTSIQALNYNYTPKKEDNQDVVIMPKKRVEKVTVKEKTVPEKQNTKENQANEKNSIATVPTLYAQPIQNGFQLVDTTPKVVYILLETNLEGVFIVKDKNAIIYKENGRWFLSYSEAETSELNIKF